MSGKSLSLPQHLLIAAGLLGVTFAVIVGRNWDTFALIYDNMAAMNEGSQVAEQIRYPEDLLSYVADHPQSVSLVAYDVGAEADGIHYQADVPRPMVSVPHLMLLAEYAHQVESEQLNPDRRVPLDSLDLYALPGAGVERHRHAEAHWRNQGYVDADSTVALRHAVRAIAQFGDRAAADWFITRLGRDRVEALPAQFGLDGSDPPRPSSGLHLSWNHHAATGTVEDRLADVSGMPAEAYARRVYRLTRALRADSAFRQTERERLRQRGTGLSLRQQRAFARATYPHGTAAAYAGGMARLAEGTFASDSVSAFLQRQLEHSIAGDSVQTAATVIASKAGALPGLISFVGYVRWADGRPPRVVTLFMEDLPIGVFYHLLQSGLDRGFQLQLLTDDAYFQTVRAQLQDTTVAAR